MKKRVLAAAALGMILTVSCFTAHAEDTDWSLGVSLLSMNDNFVNYIGKGITKYAEGVCDVTLEDGQNNQATQNNQVEIMLAKKSSVIAVSMDELASAPTIINNCKDKDVPVIFFNNQVTDPEVIASYDKIYQVISDATAWGADIQGDMAGKWFNDHPEADKNGDGKMQLIVLQGDLSHAATLPRSECAKAAIEAQGVAIDLLEEDTGNWDTTQAKEKMDAWISKYGDEVECIVTANDAMALGVLQSIEAAGFNAKGTTAGANYIAVIGIDAIPEALSKIESGEMIGSVLQDATTQGKYVVQLAQNLALGKDPGEGIDAEMEEATKTFYVPYAAVWPEDVAAAAAAYE